VADDEAERDLILGRRRRRSDGEERAGAWMDPEVVGVDARREAGARVAVRRARVRSPRERGAREREKEAKRLGERGPSAGAGPSAKHRGRLYTGGARVPNAFEHPC